MNKVKKSIPIFFSFDDGYVPQAAVTFKSLLNHCKKDVYYKLYVVYSTISLANQMKLQAEVKDYSNSELTFLKIDDKIFNFEFDDKIFNSHHLGTVFTIHTFYRCVPDLIPEFDEFDKIIYSDVDIVVQDDLSELIDNQFVDEYLAGVKIPSFLNNEISHFPSKFKEYYFSGGLWVMNLKKMREDHLGLKVLKILKNPPFKLIWNDQDVMNLACDLKVSFLSYRYISIPDWYPILKKKNYMDLYYPREELYECMHNPKIVRYAGKKPWKDLTTRKSDLWFYWLDKTGFKEDDEFKGNLFKLNKNSKPNNKRIVSIKYAFLLLLRSLPVLGNVLISDKKTMRAINKIQATI